jgi:hypothetical protein
MNTRAENCQDDRHSPLQSYDTEDFLGDVMDFARVKYRKVDYMQPVMRMRLWDKLIHEIEMEKKA